MVFGLVDHVPDSGFICDGCVMGMSANGSGGLTDFEDA